VASTGIGGILHEEHFRMLTMISALEARVSGAAATRPIDRNDARDRELLDEIVDVTGEIAWHSTFEEAVLFPLIWDKSEDDLSVILSHEHEAIRPLARRLKHLAERARSGDLEGDEWRAFRETVLALAPHVMFHLQKEELAVVQKLDTLLEPDVDDALVVHYETRQPRRYLRAAE